MSDVRRRRRERLQSRKRRELPKKALKAGILYGSLLLLIGAGATGVYYLNANQPDCPGHWHATFDVVVQGDDGTARTLRFDHPAFGPPNTGHRLHMHLADGYNQIHYEPPTSLCQGVEDVFQVLDMDVTPDRITLDGAHQALGQTGSWQADGDRTVRAFIEPMGGVWSETDVAAVLRQQLPDGTRFLLTYGDFTDEEVQTYQAAVAPPASRQGRT